MLKFKDINVLPLVYYPGNFNNKLKNSNKAIVPQFILDKLINNINENDIQYPIIFKVKTEIIDFFIGVEEFSSNNNLYLPLNIIENNFLKFNQKVIIEYSSPPKGSYIKIKPHLTKFTEIKDPKKVLEDNIIKYYPVLSKNETIAIVYNDKEYLIDIKDCEPNFVISTNNTDLTVDFDEPKDYQKIMEQQNKEKDYIKELQFQQNKIERENLLKLHKERKLLKKKK